MKVRHVYYQNAAQSILISVAFFVTYTVHRLKVLIHAVVPLSFSIGEKMITGRCTSVATYTLSSTLWNKHVTRQLGVKWAWQCVASGHSNEVLGDLTSW